MLATDILYAKTVDDQYELDGAPYVSPEARCGSSFVVPRHSESLAEEVVGKPSVMGKSICAADDGEVHPAVMYQGVFVAEFVGYVVEFDSNIFFLIHFWRLQVKIGGVEAGKSCARPVKDAVEQHLNEVKGRGECAHVAGIRDVISGDCDARAVRVGFLRSDFAHYLDMRNFFSSVARDVRVAYDAEGVRARNALPFGTFGAPPDALAEASHLV